MPEADYRTVEKLGKGAFSQVYKVERRGDRGVHYACKRIDISKMQKAELADAVNEIRILSSIKHPYIVGFYDAFLARRDRELWIVMEMCGCGDLASKVERVPQETQVHGRARRLVPLHPDVRGVTMFTRAEDRASRHQGREHFLAADGSVKIGDLKSPSA